MSTRKVILYIAMSLDGYIAKSNDDLSFLERVAIEGEDYGYTEFVNQIDTVILGRKTYDWVTAQVEFPHKDKTTFVLTRTPKESEGMVQFYTGSVTELVTRLKSESGKHIFCDGGAQTVQLLLKEELFDELIISVIPVLLGEGTRLFDSIYPEKVLKLESSKSFESGLIQLRYQVL